MFCVCSRQQLGQIARPIWFPFDGQTARELELRDGILTEARRDRVRVVRHSRRT
jgi:hypothetical protein